MDWKRKLTSRKFWLAVVGFVTQILILSGAGDSQVTQVAACIMAGATLIGYIIGEGLADSGVHLEGADSVREIDPSFYVDQSEENE